MYLTPLVGAYLADAVLGRFWVILVFSTIYFIVSETHSIPLPCRHSIPTIHPHDGLIKDGGLSNRLSGMTSVCCRAARRLESIQHETSNQFKAATWRPCLLCCVAAVSGCMQQQLMANAERHAPAAHLVPACL